MAKKKKSKDAAASPLSPKVPLSQLLRAPVGEVDVTALQTDVAPGYPGKGKADADAQRLALEPVLADLQERLYADGRSDPETAKRVLIVLQGMDTSGKGGVMRHAIGLVDPQGIEHTAFKAPSKEELSHHFLWRIRRALPGPGMIGIFDRSQYEDVLIVRVLNLVDEAVWGKRYDEINRFEQKLADDGYVIIKCFLHISNAEQKARLAERLANPEKYWKYNPGDVDNRALWDDYMAAYSALLTRCNPDHAPWYVIPSDKKWYRNWAVAELLRERLAELGLEWPEADFDVEVEKLRVEQS